MFARQSGSRSIRRTVGGSLALVLGMLAAPAAEIAFVRPAPLAAQTATCPKIIIPAYFDNDQEWQEMADTRQVGIVILNVQSGPGKRRSAIIAQRVQAVQASGARVLGYVPTDLADRPAKQVRRDIRTYWQWYGVDGIYLDEVQSEQRYVRYYRTLSRTIRRGSDGKGANNFVMINPGYTPARAYMDLADLVENYEYFHNRYAGQVFPAWVHEYPANRFAHVVHNVPNTPVALAATLAEARANNAGYVFITNRANPRQYKGLPSFWDTKVDVLCS